MAWVLKMYPPRLMAMPIRSSGTSRSSDVSSCLAASQHAQATRISPIRCSAAKTAPAADVTPMNEAPNSISTDCTASQR